MALVGRRERASSASSWARSSAGRSPCGRASSTPACPRRSASSAARSTLRPVASGTAARSSAPGRSCDSLAIPILVADLVQVAVNLVLLAGVIRVSGGGSMRSQMLRLLGSTGPAYLGYGAIAFLLVVLWEPAGLGPASVVSCCRRSSWPAGPTCSTPRSSRAMLGRSACSSPRSRPRRPTWPVTARAWPSSANDGRAPRAARAGGGRHAGRGDAPRPGPDDASDRARARVGGSGGDLVRTYPARGAEVLQDLGFLSGSLDAISQAPRGRPARMPPTLDRPAGAGGRPGRRVRPAHRGRHPRRGSPVTTRPSTGCAARPARPRTSSALEHGAGAPRTWARDKALATIGRPPRAGACSAVGVAAPRPAVLSGGLRPSSTSFGCTR